MSDFKLKTAAGQVVEFPAALLASISNDLFELTKEARHAYISGFADQLMIMNRFIPDDRKQIVKFMKNLAKKAQAMGFDDTVPPRPVGSTYFEEILAIVTRLPAHRRGRKSHKAKDFTAGLDGQCTELKPPAGRINAVSY